MALINPLIGSNLVTGVAPFDSTLIGNSIWLEGAGTSGDAMTRLWGAESNQDRWIWATWYQPLRVIDAESKRNNLFASGSSSNGFYLNHTSTSSTFNLFHRDNAGSEGAINTTASYRDTTSWIHVLVDYDSANAIAANRISLYINGVRTGVNSGNRPGQNNHINVNVQNQTARIGQDLSTTPNYHVQGYLAQTVFLDNKSIANGDLAITDFLDTFTFGTNGSQIVPKADADIIALASAAGANSFCLDYSNATSGTTLVADASSKGNNFSTSTIATANQSTSTPSKTFATYNPLFAPKPSSSSHTAPTFSNGNTIATNTNSAWSPVSSSFGVSSGKWYFETKIGSVGNGVYVGVVRDNIDVDTGQGKKAYRSVNGQKYDVDNSNASYGDSFTTNDIIGTAVDLEGGGLWFSKNGTWQNSATISEIEAGTTTNAAFTDLVSTLPSQGWFFGGQNAGSPTASTEINFGFGTYSISSGNTDSNGHGNFEYPPPANFLSLCTANLTAPDFQGIDYFDVTLYEGNGFNQRVGDFVPFTDTYTVDKSAMFDDGDRRYLAKTFDSGDATATSDPGGSNSAKATISFWIKYCRSVGSGDQYIFSTANTAQTQRFMIYRNEQSAEDFFFINMNPGPKMFKAPVQSALLSEQEWSNVVINVDLDNGTGADKVKMFVNGVQITSVDTTYQSASNSNYFLFANEDHFIGNLAPADAGYTGFCLDSYLAEMHVIDGHVKAPTDFGQVDTATNRWVAKDYKTNVNTYGNRGFYMAFDNASGTSDGVGTDSSGNNFHFTESFVSGGSAWAISDTVTDTPSQNFDVLGGAQVGGTISEGNTKAALGTGGNQIRSNFNLSSGKWYVESDIQATNNSASIGLVPSRSDTFSNGPGRDANGGISYETDGDVFSDNVQNATAEASFAAGDVIQMAIDMDAKKVYFGKNNTFGGNPAAGTGGHFLPASILSDGAALITLGNYSGSQSSTQQINYGQFLNFDGGSTTNGFKYTPPTGFKAVNQDNLDDTASKLTAWAWIKNRDAADDHVLVDRIRGTGKVWESNTNTTAFTNNNTVQRFLQRGVQVGSDVTVNTANESYVLWQWLAGDSATTGSTTSPAGTIASTTIVADTGHFSVGSYTGNGTDNSTVGHGLGGIPEMIIVRNLSRSTFSLVWHTDGGGATHTADFAVAATFSANSQKFGGSDASNPTADVFKIGDHNEINANTESFVFYALRSIAGVCKVGSYVGNSNASGPYVSTGFTPRFVMIKNLTTATRNWCILDTARTPNNVTSPFVLLADKNDDDEAGTIGEFDMLSDGFKLRANSANANNSGDTYIYMAMAEIGGNGTLPPIYGR